MIRKWLLLTSSDDETEDDVNEPGSPAGFLQITAMVLGPGDEIPEQAKISVIFFQYFFQSQRY